MQDLFLVAATVAVGAVGGYVVLKPRWRGRAEQLDALAGQNRILERIATGHPQGTVLHDIVRWVEGSFPGMLCSIVLLDPEGKRLRTAAAPSLPAAYSAAIDALEIGPEVGSCGTAAYLKRLVVVRDIATDPLWARYRELALPHGLRACWSSPILSSDGSVLGTLAMYYPEPCEPSLRELEAIRGAASIAGIALERSRADEKMKSSQERFELLARATNELVWDWNLLDDQIWWNEGYQTILGYPPGEMSSHIDSWKSIIHPDDAERVLNEVDSVIKGGSQSWQGEYRLRRKDGSYVVVFDRGFVVRDAERRPVRMIGSAMDITERKRAEEQLAQLAQFDTLTGLPNRNLFMDRLGQAVSRARREEWLVALVFLDLDHFKEINDSLGHAAGDEVLRAIGGRLKQCMREGDTVARLGGDEFTVILEDAGAPENVAKVARKVLEVFAQPVRIAEHELFVSPSIGIALYPYDGSDADMLLKHADIAMYQAKAQGRNNYQLYDAAMSSAASERMTLERSLRQALERGELRLHYQPVVEIASGRVTGAEALLLWQHPQRGLVGPAEFIAIAEQTGLIVAIGEWVMSEACAQAMRWQAAGLPPLQLSVNLSPRQFRKGGLAGAIAGCVEGSGLAGERLMVEITESLLMENPAGSRALLEKIKAMGVHVALDDFGTGYSSLAYLRHFPLDVVKIDRSFVRDLADPETAIIVKAMINLAHNLQLSLTAEGVETQAQLDFLKSQGCERAQGYLFARPMAAADFEAFINKGGST